jgi:membrane protein
MGDFLPQGEEQIREIIEEAHAARAGAGLISFLLLMWTGSHVFAAMTTALNLAYDVEETYGFFKRLLIRFLMLGTIGVFFVLALSSQFLLSLSAAAFEHLPADMGWFFTALRIVAPMLLLLAAFFLIYRFVPRSRPDWRAALLGSAFATAAFLLARPLFTEYLRRFGTDFNVIYGSLGIGIILLFWAWIVAVILLLGGEISAHVNAIVCEGQSVQEVEEHHLARSPDRKELAGKRQSKSPPE